MSERIKCPSCGAGLVRPESVRESPATCPRCLAAIPAPEATRVQDTIQAERPARHEAPLRGREPDVYGRTDLDVRRDTKQTGCLVTGLACVGLLGILSVGFESVSVAADSDIIMMMMVRMVYFIGILVVALLFLVGLSTLIVFLRSGGNPGASGFRQVVVGTLALAGVVTLVMISSYVCIYAVCSQFDIK